MTKSEKIPSLKSEQELKRRARQIERERRHEQTQEILPRLREILFSGIETDSAEGHGFEDSDDFTLEYAQAWRGNKLCEPSLQIVAHYGFSNDLIIRIVKAVQEVGLDGHFYAETDNRGERGMIFSIRVGSGRTPSDEAMAQARQELGS
jgi:hypothetical protein